MNLAKYDQQIPLDRECRIIGYDQSTQVFAIEKASGVLTHPNSASTKQRTLLSAHYDMDEEKYSWKNDAGINEFAYLVHRLDSPTSGIILVCLNQSISLQLKQAFFAQKVNKTYLAIVRQPSSFNNTVWRDKLYEVREKGKLRMKWGTKGKPAITEVSLANIPVSSHRLAMLILRPRTGRTHQLRVQCAKRGMPIVGDRTYGDFSLNRKVEQKTKVSRLCLHACEISYELQLDGGQKKSFFYESPIPRSLGKLLK